MERIKLKEEDRKRMVELNAKNEWGLDYEEFIDIVNLHEKAKSEKDLYTCALIEYRLTDINYHTEVSMLENDKYDELRKMAIEEF